MRCPDLLQDMGLIDFCSTTSDLRDDVLYIEDDKYGSYIEEQQFEPGAQVQPNPCECMLTREMAAVEGGHAKCIVDADSIVSIAQKAPYCSQQSCNA